MAQLDHITMAKSSPRCRSLTHLSPLRDPGACVNRFTGGGLVHAHLPGRNIHREKVMPARTIRFPKAILARLAVKRLPADTDCPDVTQQQRASAEVAKLVRKLRWIGMEDDAKRLERALCGAAVAAPVLH
jgi:hypothetical protein